MANSEERKNKNMSTATRPRPAIAPLTATQPLELSIAPNVADELDRLARETGQTTEWLIAYSLGLARAAIQAKANRKRVLITNRAGWPLRELTIP